MKCFSFFFFFNCFLFLFFFHFPLGKMLQEEGVDVGRLGDEWHWGIWRRIPNESIKKADIIYFIESKEEKADKKGGR